MHLAAQLLADSALLPSRIQMAFTLAYHVILVPLGVALPTYTLLMEGIALRNKDATALKLARRWSVVMAVQMSDTRASRSASTTARAAKAVMNAVPDHQVGVASGVNNTVARVAGLLAVAVLGAVAHEASDRTLERRLASLALPPHVREAVRSIDGSVGSASLPPLPEHDRQLVETALAESFVESFRVVALSAAALALLGALGAALLIPSRKP